MKLIYQNKVYKISQVKQGPQGAKGLSNYQIYLANTNDDPVLSEAEWIAATDAARIAAENSATAAANSAAAAATSEGNASNSATAAAASEANATASATAAAASETNAANSAAAASASEANAASSETNAANSAAAAAASEANAATSETNAANSAAAAAGSEANAGASAAAAATSEGNAANSATAAAASEANAAASATAAAASETNAANSAAAASASEANAASSETNAANSAAAAAASEANAATSETNASNSATAAAGSETNAANSAAAAATSEGNAATSETNATASAAAAATSAASVAEEVNTVAGNFYTLVAGDNRDIVHCTNINGCNVRIPSGLDSGYRVRVMMTSGNGLISAANGVSFNGVEEGVIHVGRNYKGYLITHLGGDLFSIIEEPDYLFTPAMLMDAKRGMLAEGGVDAVYLDKVAAATDETSNGCNPVQGTATMRPTNIPDEGRNYLHNSGLNSNNVTVPDSAATSVTGPIDLIGCVRVAEYSGFQYIVSKYFTGGNQRSYGLYVSGTFLAVVYSFDGATGVPIATGVIPVPAGQDVWLRATVDPDNGAGGADTNGYYSTDPVDTDPDDVTWTQLGETETAAGSGAIFGGTADVIIGSYAAGLGGNFKGKIHRVLIKDGIDGTTVLDWDADRDANDNDTNGTEGTGQPWTLNQSGDNPSMIVGGAFLRGDGADDRMHTGDVLPPLQAQCSMALRCRPLRTGAGTETLMENDSSSNRFLFRVSPAGTPFCYLSNGSFNANIYATSNLTLRQWHTLIAVWDNDNISFYIDGVAAGSSVVGFSVIPTASNTEASLWSERGGANIGCFDISKAISFPQHALTAAEVSEIHNLLNS